MNDNVNNNDNNDNDNDDNDDEQNEIENTFEFPKPAHQAILKSYNGIHCFYISRFINQNKI